jgi:hypothetical protein
MDNHWNVNNFYLDRTESGHNVNIRWNDNHKKEYPWKVNNINVNKSKVNHSLITERILMINVLVNDLNVKVILSPIFRDYIRWSRDGSLANHVSVFVYVYKIWL